jgi:hypothetical protein
VNATSIVLTLAGFVLIGVAFVAAGSVSSRMFGVGIFLAGLGVFANGIWQLATRHRRPIADLRPLVRLVLYGPNTTGVPDEFTRVVRIAFQLVVAAAFMVGGIAAVVS